MKTDHDNIIDIVDSQAIDDRPVETPVISIEKESAGKDRAFDKNLKGATTYRFLLICSILAIIALAGAAWHYRNELLSPNVPVSLSDEEMLEKIAAAYTPSAVGTVHTSDSVLGVAMDFFSLDGLKASLEKSIPNPADSTLVLFMRSADYKSDKSVIGPLVIEGEKHKGDNNTTRQAYMAITKDGRPLIGISLTDKVMNKIAEQEGSFFRQYLLLSAGELPERFQLHGKVERAAIGRMSDDRLFYVITRHPETMYDFADAMREYGFIDALYLTGGKSYSFHRDTDGTAHTDSATLSKINKYSHSDSPAPFLVFRNR